MDNIKPDDRTRAILMAAFAGYRSAESLRLRRERFKQFTYGDQWSDMIADGAGNLKTRREIAQSNGRHPMTNNLIRRLVRCVVGHYRLSGDDHDKSADPFVSRVSRLNSLDEIDARTLEEFLISGCAIQRVYAENRPGLGTGVWVDAVSPNRLIINNISDPRGWDAEMVGMIHDMSRAELLMRYGHGKSGRIEALDRIYGSPGLTMGDEVGMPGCKPDFFRGGHGRCRVYEVWTLEAASRLRVHDTEQAALYSVADTPENIERLIREQMVRKSSDRGSLRWRRETVTMWRGRWITPDGSLLDSRLSSRHPFTVKLYPLTDGEVHSLVEDVIDQQIYINQLITLTDHIVGASAKGALLFPIKQKLPEVSWEDIAHRWAAPDGIIPIVGNESVPEPKQVSGNGSDGGTRELLQLQMKMFEEVSGVTNALMGRSSGGGNVGVDRYEAEVRNGTASILDLLRSFDHFKSMRDALILTYR